MLVCVRACVRACVIFLFSFSVCYLFMCISLQFGGIKVEILKYLSIYFLKWHDEKSKAQ